MNIELEHEEERILSFVRAQARQASEIEAEGLDHHRLPDMVQRGLVYTRAWSGDVFYRATLIGLQALNEHLAREASWRCQHCGGSH